MTKEQKFFQALQDIFIGAKIDGKGGFINLMQIKSKYYEQIEILLKQDIYKALKEHSNFREELFDKLHSFFSRYFSESGSIYFNSTPFHNNIYEKVYTDEKDVVLFWKTQMLYYVKSDRIFRSTLVEFDVFKFYFDAENIKPKKANEKKSLVFEFKEVKEDRTICFAALHSDNGTKTKTEDILRAIKKAGVFIKEEELEKAFRIFNRQAEVDFFINKNAKAFLEEQFKLWSYQYLWEGAKEWSAIRINQLQILKNIAFKIIDFVAQFENELVKIWNKPKFAKNSNYVLTLDRIADKILLQKILKHGGIKEQIQEWQELGIVESDFKIETIFETDLNGNSLTKKHKHLPIDTKHFKDLELEILGLFDDLDKQLDGWLIKSENYQALNTILPKFKEKIQTIYIDPPFNLENNADYDYLVKYKDSSWATLLENRLKLAKEVLHNSGSIFVRCDYHGNWIVRCLLDKIFNYQNEIIISKSAKLTEQINKYHSGHDSLFFYSKSNQFVFSTATKKRDNPKWRAMHLPGIRWSPIPDEYIKLFSKKNIRAQSEKRNGKATTRARIILNTELLPPDGRHWALNQKFIFELEKENKIKWSNGDNKTPQIEETETQKLTDNWTDWVGYSSTWGFTTENSEKLLARVINTGSKEKDLIFDYFLGSGTTTAVAHKLGRKWLGVEMGEHFYSVVLPRMKEVLAYDKSGISKDTKDYKGGGFFKYYELEQYEETLENTKYGDANLFNQTSDKAYQDYVFMKDEKMLKCLEIDYQKNKATVDLKKLYPNVDIAETLSCLNGKWIKMITEDEVLFTDGSKENTKELDYKKIKPLIWWE